MELKEGLSVVECVETISNRLGELSNLITTIHLGLKAEKTEKQTLDCMMCIRYSVNELHKLAEETLSEVREKANVKK